MMLLSVMYACNLGGTGSLIGAAPNQILKNVFDHYIRAPVPLVLASAALFIIPRELGTDDTIPILTWAEVNTRVSWGTVLVICGGLSLAEASTVGTARTRRGNLVEQILLGCYWTL
ncbi:hypothetical protein V5799_007623 [Amblyomma americanum]|uniref:Uncharacterized protein n=1 Tax=Amblyomma americanum TaxID=6943 RepID=A0AAQ4FH29_AMBAM